MATTSTTIVFITSDEQAADTTAALGFRAVFPTELHMNQTLIVVDPDIQSGTPVFAGTRVPIQNLFDFLEEGDSLNVFLDQFPSVSREVAVAVLEQARSALLPDAHSA